MPVTFEQMRSAEAVIHGTLLEERPKLLAAAGNVAHVIKPDLSVVTDHDKQLEQKLREVLAASHPSIGFGGEESGVDFTQKRFWLVDPIDGTLHLVEGRPGWASQIALMENGQPTMGIIYGFAEDEWYTAYAGRGAFLNGERITVGSRPLAEANINFNVAHNFRSAESRGKAERVGQLACAGFCSTILAARQVATGQIDAYVSIDGNGGPWDYAPRVLLMQEAGARVTNLDGGPYDFRDPNFIAATPSVYDAIFAAINPNA